MLLAAVLAAGLVLTLAHCDSPKTPPKSSADHAAISAALVESGR